MDHEIIGKHIILECSGEQAHLDLDCMEQLMSKAAISAGATIITSKFHHFGEEQGVTGVLVLAESHITVHTWPEKNYAAFDVFMCGHCDPEVAVNIIIAYDKNTEYKLNSLNRVQP